MFFKKNKNKIQEPVGDKILQIFTTVFLLIVLTIVAYPVLYVISSSLSDSTSLTAGRVYVVPIVYDLKEMAYRLGVDFSGYKFVFAYEDVWTGYKNTVIYTVLGTMISLFLMTLMAYPLSKANYQGKKLVSKLMLFAMMFGGGLVPTYILRTQLGLNGNIFAILLHGCLSINNVFILRTSFRSSIPGDLFDAAKIDGANDFQCLVRIAIPLAKATLSVLILYAAVRYWNDYFTAMLYLAERQDLWPLQLFLRNFLLSTKEISSGGMSAEAQEAFNNSGVHQIQFCLVVISTAPILILYSVVQKYFEKGVMIGSVKG